MELKKIKEPSQQESEEIIHRLVKECNETIQTCRGHFNEMEEAGEPVSGFIYSHVTDEEDKKKGILFCAGKTIAELQKMVEQPKPQDNPNNKLIEDTDEYATAIVNDPAYRERTFLRGIEKYLEEVKKLS